MREWDRSIRNDLALRVAGVLLMIAGMLAARHLYEGVQAARGSAAPALQLLWGAAAFIGCTSGGILTCLGGHIHDNVRVSRPWNGQNSTTRLASPARPARAAGVSARVRPFVRTR